MGGLVEPRSTKSGSNNGNNHDGHEDEEEDDLLVLLVKEESKIEEKTKKDKEPLDKKKEKEALKEKGSKEKAKKGKDMAKEGEEKAASEAPYEPQGKSSSILIVDLQIETLLPNPCKHNADFIGFSVSMPSLKDSSVNTIQVDEFLQWILPNS